MRLLLIGTAVTLILCQDQTYAKNESYHQKSRQKRLAPLAAINVGINGIAALITIGQYVDTFFDYESFAQSSWQEIDKGLKQFEKDAMDQFALNVENIRQIPQYLSFLDDENNFRKHLYRIHEVYRIILRQRKLLDKDFLTAETVDFQRKYIDDFVREQSTLLEESMLEIRRIFLDTDTTGFLSKNIFEGRKKFVSVCRTDKSEIQVLDALLASIQTAFGEYYFAKTSLFDILQFTDAYLDGTRSVEILDNNIESDYKNILNVFKNEMRSASTEFRKCDARLYADDERYGSHPEYFELRQFSKYLLNTHDIAEPTCAANKLPERCHNDVSIRTEAVSICPRTRRCRKEFLYCRPLRPKNTDSKTAGVCLKERGSTSRYSEINLFGSDLKCPFGEKKEIKYFEGHDKHYCECLCHEIDYYFIDDPVWSDFEHDSVITGVRFRISSKNYIHIEIQEAKMSPNQINATEAIWKERDWTNKQPNVINGGKKMHTLEPVELSEIKNLKYNEAIVGLRLHQDPNTGRVQLRAYTMDYDYATGKVDSATKREHLPTVVTTEYVLENQGVPIKGPLLNQPMSRNNQYVSFTTTGMIEDGGQTTIPFIDTQDVASSGPPMPLSGIGLYLRGQPGYAGFLAFKIYTYDAVSYLDAHTRTILH